MAPGGQRAVSLHSRSVVRAMASNRECQRLYQQHRSQISMHKHRARCDINQEIHQIKAEMHKLRMKTPTLGECMAGKPLCGIEPSGQSKDKEAVTTGATMPGAGIENRVQKSRTVSRRTVRTRISNMSSGSARARRVAAVSSADDTREKIADFFERSKHLLEKPAEDPRVPEWSRGSKLVQAFYRTRNDVRLAPSTQKTAIYGTNVTVETRQKERAATPANKNNRRKTAPKTTVERDVNNNPVNKENLADLIQTAWRGTMCTANPYQAFFKPESSTIRLAHQMVLVSRKLKNISISRVRKEQAVELLKEEKERKKREAEEARKKKSAWCHVDSEDFD